MRGAWSLRSWLDPLRVHGRVGLGNSSLWETGTPKSRAVAAALGREAGFLRLGDTAEIKIRCSGAKIRPALLSRGFLALAPRGGWETVAVVPGRSRCWAGGRGPVAAALPWMRCDILVTAEKNHCQLINMPPISGTVTKKPLKNQRFFDGDQRDRVDQSSQISEI